MAKNTKEIEDLSTEPLNISSEDIDKFGKKEMMKKRLVRKNTWYDSLINYIPETLRKLVDGIERKVMSLFK